MIRGEVGVTEGGFEFALAERIFDRTQGSPLQNGIGYRKERAWKIEEDAAFGGVPLTEEQVLFIESANPCYRERGTETTKPGEILAQGTFLLARLKNRRLKQVANTSKFPL